MRINLIFPYQLSPITIRFIMLGLGMIAVIFPQFVYGIIGLIIGLIGFAAAFYITLNVIKLYQNTRVIYPLLIGQIIMLALFAFIIILIPGSLIQQAISLLSVILLTIISGFYLYMIPFHYKEKLTISQLIYGLVSFVLLIYVLINFSTTPLILMQILGVYLIYSALNQWWQKHKKTYRHKR
jgi:hypothetical protein